MNNYLIALTGDQPVCDYKGATLTCNINWFIMVYLSAAKSHLVCKVTNYFLNRPYQEAIKSDYIILLLKRLDKPSPTQ